MIYLDDHAFMGIMRAGSAIYIKCFNLRKMHILDKVLVTIVVGVYFNGEGLHILIYQAF